MPVAVSYPGVYIEEVPSGVRTITGVATSITAFIGRARKGPETIATTVNSYGEFERLFGGLWAPSGGAALVAPAMHLGGETGPQPMGMQIGDSIYAGLSSEPGMGAAGRGT